VQPKRLPFETHWKPAEHERAWRWYQELERLGPDNVRARVAQHDAGSAGALRGVGAEPNLTKGFAEDWLRYRDERESKKATRRFWITTTVALISAIAAIIAASPVLREWFRYII
jgi:hypothetical protein